MFRNRPVRACVVLPSSESVVLCAAKVGVEEEVRGLQDLGARRVHGAAGEGRWRCSSRLARSLRPHDLSSPSD